MVSHVNTRSTVYRIGFIVMLASVIALFTLTPGIAGDGSGGGGLPPNPPTDTTVEGGGSSIPITIGTDPDEQQSVDSDWNWMIDLFAFASSAIL